MPKKIKLPSAEAYGAAMTKHHAHPVNVEMTAGQLTMLLSTMQLALRHPQYPEHMRPIVQDFVDGAIEQLETLDPVIGAVFRAGNDPAQDV